MTEENNNQNQSNINAKDFLIGVLVGGMAGAASALLLAPKSGKELRDDLNEQASLVKNRTGDWRESAEQVASTVKDQSISLAKNVGDQSRQMSERVKQAVGESDKEEYR